jgi:hypothetical protein
MNRIVRENYPVANLPEDLRPTTDPNAVVTVTIEDVADEMKRPEQIMTFEEIFSLTGFRRLSKYEIDEDIRRQRDEWDD